MANASEAYKIADDTWVVPAQLPVPTFGYLPINSMVIKGKEPVLVETGLPVFRKEFLETTFSLVDPQDVKWIFLSHEDRDHAGNLAQVLEMCPSAKLVTNFIGLGKLAEEFTIPLERVVMAPDKEAFDVGDRTLVSIRPPLYDSPSTRGVWDAKNELYYSADAFGAVLPDVPEYADEVEDELYEDGFNWMNRANHIWHALTDPAKMDVEVDRIRELNAKVIVSSHGPVMRNDIKTKCDMLSRIPRLPALPEVTQDMLEERIEKAEFRPTK
ncbi:MAG: MBL fold metallo-hydrolase [Actinomycetota bacterium]